MDPYNLSAPKEHFPSSDDFYVEKSDDISKLLQKRSIQAFKRRESIQITPVRNIHRRSISENETPSLNKTNDTLKKCCPQKTCVCKDDCFVPQCGTHEVPIANFTENGKPGVCCPKYKCDNIPNCQILGDDFKWLQPCKECKCDQNETFCHEKCIDNFQPSSCFSHSKNRGYLHGQFWMDTECTQCECDMGNLKCQSNVCRPLHCPKKIKLPGECCPVCDHKESHFCNGHEACELVCQFGYEQSNDCSFCKCAVELIEVTSIPDDKDTIIQKLESDVQLKNILLGIFGIFICVLAAILALVVLKHHRSRRMYSIVSSLDSNLNKIQKL